MKIGMFFLIAGLFYSECLGEERGASSSEYSKTVFESVTYTRSWELGMWRLRFGDEKPLAKKSFERSMVAYAFNYWFLVNKKIIDPVPTLESRIRLAFTKNELGDSHLEVDLDNRFAVAGFAFSDQEYEELIKEFKAFCKVGRQDE